MEAGQRFFYGIELRKLVLHLTSRGGGERKTYAAMQGIGGTRRNGGQGKGGNREAEMNRGGEKD